MRPGMMPTLALPGEMTPGQLGPMRRVSKFLTTSQTLTMSRRGDTLGDADNQREPRSGGLKDAVRGEGRRDEDDGDVGAGSP